MPLRRNDRHDTDPVESKLISVGHHLVRFARLRGLRIVKEPILGGCRDRLESEARIPRGTSGEKKGERGSLRAENASARRFGRHNTHRNTGGWRTGVE
jgi:hypothetical protein